MEIVIVLLLFAVFSVFLAVFTSRNRSKLKSAGIDIKHFIRGLQYAGGHPALEKQTVINLGLNERGILLISLTGKQKAFIPGNAIRTIKAKVTLTNAEQVKILSQKGANRYNSINNKELSKAAYLVIDWNDGKNDLLTIFRFRGTHAYSEAEKVRERISVYPGNANSIR